MRAQIGARSFIAQRIARQRIASKAVTTPTSCVTDSFDKANGTLGPDQTWEVGHNGQTQQIASPFGIGAQIYDHGTGGANYRTLEVHSNAATFKMMEDAVLPGGYGWARGSGYARAGGDVGSISMTISATLTNDDAKGAYYLFGRSAPDPVGYTPHTGLELGTPVGWLAQFFSGYVELDCDYVSSVNNPGTILSFFVTSESGGWSLATGSQIMLGITGPVIAPTVTLALDGVTLLSVNPDTGYGDDVNTGDSHTDFPNGQQAGFGFQSNIYDPSITPYNHADDFYLGIEQFSACPR